MGILSKTLTKFGTKNNKFMLAVGIIMTFCLITTISAGTILSGKKAKKYAQKSFYIVYANKFVSDSLATEMCAQVSDRGGAGVIYAIGNTKFVVANVYIDNSSAKSVCAQIKDVYEFADILEIVAPKLKKSKCLQLENNTNFRQFYEMVYSACLELYGMVLQTDKGDLSCSECYKQIMKIKQNCEKLCEKLSESDDVISVSMYDSGLVLVQLVRTFFDSAFINNLVAKPIKKLYANWVFEFVNMCQRLKNL